jgi:glyoxylase-like metal-dependent hydrolase (beta-lactamase superfamily II)
VSDVQIFGYESPHDDYQTCSYYYETDRGVVLFDAQFHRSSAEQLWDQIQENTSGEIACIVVSHAHPDHWFGLPVFRERSPRAIVISSDAVAREMRETSVARLALCKRRYGDECPAALETLVYPDVTFTGHATIGDGETRLELLEYGASEAPVNVVGWMPGSRALFVGDIVFQKQHLYFPDRALISWYSILQDFERLAPEVILTGHVDRGGPELINENKRWIATYLGLMANEVPRGSDIEDVDTLDDAARARVVAAMRAAFPDWVDISFVDGTVLEAGMVGTRSEVEGLKYAEQYLANA